MLNQRHLFAPASGEPSEVLPAESPVAVTELPAADASEAPQAAPSESPAPTDVPETSPAPTLPVVSTSAAPSDTVELTEVPVTDVPGTDSGHTGFSGWVVAGAALLAALIVAAIFLALGRKKRGGSASEIKLGLDYAVGKVHEQGARESQQDCFAVSPDQMRGEFGLLAVVADGMGGLSDGDKVSQAAVGAMLDGFSTAQGDGQLVLLKLLGRANRSVNQLLGTENLSKSGSTLAAALIRDGRFYWLTVGDSRIALLRGEALIQLNREHVFKNELLLSAVNGSESFASALSHPKAAGLTSYLGMGRLKYVDIPAAPIDVLPGDKFVLMSDGIYNALDDAELISALSHPAQKAAEVVGKAVTSKGYKTQDNFTAIIIEAVSGGKQGEV